MLFILLLLIVIILVVVGMIALQQWNLAKMNRQLQDILHQFGTNETLRTNISDKQLNRFVANVNRLIGLFKKEEQESARKNRVLKQEITNISHDLRTPLTSIKGFTELLQDSQLSKREREEYLEIIQKKVETLMRIVDTFYEISLLDSDENEPLFEHFPLGDVLVENLLLFQKDFENKKITVKIDETDLFSVVYADKKETERIILNLIQNVLRYTTTFFQVTVINEADYCILKMCNDTYLMTSEAVEHIFERFYTGDPSRQKGQTGMGLYIVKRLVERQGGEIRAIYENGFFSIEILFRRD